MKLLCKGFYLEAQAESLPTLRAEFVIPISPQDTDEIALAFHAITLYLSEKIELVKSQPGKWRCFYCASLNDDKENQCSQCGGIR